MLTDEHLETIEHTLAGIAVLIVFVCTLGGPHINRGPTRQQLVRSYVRNSHRVLQLQSSLETTEGHVKAQKTELATATNQINALQKERDAISKHASDEAAKIKELEAQLQTAKAEIAKLNDVAAVENANRTRDAALARANKAEDRIRDLTLQLHNAGIWP
jgi:septal ring factor EnvC (AmiA/AmiB activator)